MPLKGGANYNKMCQTCNFCLRHQPCNVQHKNMIKFKTNSSGKEAECPKHCPACLMAILKYTNSQMWIFFLFV